MARRVTTKSGSLQVGRGRSPGSKPMTDPSLERPAAARHITLTSHPRPARTKVPKIAWGAANPAARGPVIGTLADAGRRNVIGAHSGSYALYRALAVAAGSLDALHRPDLTNTAPAMAIGPHPAMGRSEEDRLARPLRPHRRRSLREPARFRLGHPADDRGDPGAAHGARAQARGPPRAAAAGRPDRDRDRRGQLHQDRDRAGLVPAGRRRALRRRPRPSCAAICSSRPAACSPSS